MKRFLSFVLAVLMVFTMSVSIVATDTEETPAITPETVGADGVSGGAVITLYDEPVVTTVGTKANLLGGLPANEAGKTIYTAQTTGARGLAFILKVDGCGPEGTILGKFFMKATVQMITATDAETGEKTYSDPTTASCEWNGNWVNDSYSTNSYAVSGDGYYIYWFPFRNIHNSWTNVETVEGVTTLDEANIFHQYGALGNNRAGQIVADADITVSCLGIIEGSIDAYDVIAYNKQTDAYEAKASGVSINALSGSNTAQWRKIAEPAELFGGLYGAGENEYVSSWTDRDGNAIDGSFESLLGTKVVKPVYSEYALEDLAKLTFVDAEGTVIGEGDFLNGVGFISGGIPADPAKAGDGVLKYVFKGWSIDGENIIDVLNTEYEGDTTLKPVFAEYGAYYDADPVTLPVVSSEVTETVDETKTVENDDGSKVEYVTKTITVTTTYPGEEPVTKTTSIIYKKTTKADSTVTTAYESNSAKNEIAALNVLPGEVAVDPLANGVTFVYKVDGIESEAIVDNLSLSIIGKTNAGAWQWDDPRYSNDDLAPSQLTLDKNGYFYIYFNDNINGLSNIYDVTKTIFTEFELFHGAVNQTISSEDGSLRGPVNANENATFRMLAAISDNLQPTVTYLNEDGSVYQTVTHKYTDITGNLGYNNGNMPRSCQNGELLSADEIFDASGLELPTKASDNPEVIYEFKGWVDADGNAVDNIYTNTTVTASFEEKDLRTQYTVKFVDEDGTVLQESIVLEGDTPEYKGETPAKANTATTAYKFKGWDKEIVATPATPEADGALAAEAIVYTATYEEMTAAELTAQAGTYFEGETALDPVVLGTTEQKVWEGSVELISTSENGAGGVTFVYKVDGVKSPISAGRWDVGFNGTTWSYNNWFYNNAWGGKWSCEIVEFDKDGYYYTYLPQRISTAGSPGLIKNVESFVLFKSSSNHPVSNENENATLTMLAILDNNLNATVNFYDAEGNFIATASKKYTNGAETTGSVVWDSTPADHGMLLTPSELATEAGIALPTKEATEEYRYQLVWADADGNQVDAIYKSQDLYAKFIEIDNTISTVTFVDADGNVVSESNQKKGGAPVYEGADPKKAEDDDYTYTFAGWSLDGENIVDLSTLTLSENEYTFKAMFVADLKVKADIDAPDTIEMGAEVEISFVYNREHVSADVLKDQVVAITAGEITVTYDKTIFNIAGNEGENTGSATVSYGDTLKLVALDGRAGYSRITVTGGKVSGDTVADVTVYSTEKLIGVVGRQPGAYFDLEPVAINKDDGENKPAGQNLWDGKVNVLDAEGNAVDGVTFVYKLAGIETEIIADNFNVVLNGSTHGWNSWNWQNGGNTGGMVSAEQKFSADGYYFMYLNQIPNGANPYKTVDSFRIFQHSGSKGGPNRTNANENATFQMLAIVSDNLTPTVNFYNGDELITSYTHAYTNYDGKLWNSNAKTVGNLLTIDEVVTLAAVETPTKAPTHDGKVTYEFDGWVDAEGNAVEVLYYNVDLYPSFKIASDTRETYTVKFVDEDGTELYSTTILEGETPVYSGEAPAKAADKKNTYVFAGWDAEIVAATADATYKATYTATEIIYTVTFMNGEDEVAKSTTTYEGAVEAPEAPAKEATAEFTYTFAGWVDADGKEVDLDNITDNVTVYTSYTSTTNKYTVTFMDGETEVGKSTVDYGTAAEKPADPTKEATDEYTYTFKAWVDAEGNAVDLTKVVADITVYASYTETKNEVTVTFMNGKTEFEKVTVNYGTEAKATADPTRETASFTKYTFAGWVDAEGNAVDLTKVEADMTVYASYTGECEHNFPDIKEGEWYEAAVEWALMNGVMNGEGSVFNPNKATTRGMIVTVLYRLEGSPDVSDVEHPFTDIKEGAWYYDAVKWAYAEEVVNGMSPTTYAPTSTLTREQFATILCRYANKIKGEDIYVPEGANLDKYTDKGKVSDYAFDAVLWTNVNGYISGTSETTLSPKGSATRAQMATILYRYITAE